MPALLVVVLAGAALRVAGIGDQSFWRDEASTVLDVEGDLGDLWSRLVAFEGMPPLYFLLAWPWSKAVGDGEAALRALSALGGAATIPLAWALARRLAAPPRAAAAGLLGAALVAFNPFLVWFSQEARAYALLALLCALATLLFVRALQDGGRRDVVLWGVAAAGTLATHWFGAFLVAAQAAGLLAVRRRAAVAGLAVPAATGLALVPLVLAQRDARVDWVSASSSPATRTVDVAKHWAAGPFGTPADAAGAVAVLLIAAGAVLALSSGRRGTAAAVLAVTAAAVAIPVALAAVGVDYVLDRYLIGALVPLLALAGAGFARSRIALPAAGAALAALSCGFAIDQALDEERHREDWRAVAARIAAAQRPVAVVAGRDGEPPLEVYLPRAVPLPAGAPLREVVVAASWRFGRPRPATPPPPSPAFRVAGRTELPTATVVRYVAADPVVVDPAALAALNLDPAEAPALRLLAGG